MCGGVKVGLGDDSEPGYELINLNKLTHKNSIIENQFKLVKDTNLVNYIDLIKDVLNHNTLVVLKKNEQDKQEEQFK